MNSFSFTIPQNIKVGAGSLSLLPDLAKELGKSKAYIISGPHLNKIGMVAKCQEALKAAGMDSDTFTETEGNQVPIPLPRQPKDLRQVKRISSLRLVAAHRLMWQKLWQCLQRMAEILWIMKAAERSKDRLFR